MLIASNFLGRAIALVHVKFVSRELESLCGRPNIPIVTVDSCKLTAVRDCPCVRLGVELVLNLVNVGIPA